MHSPRSEKIRQDIVRLRIQGAETVARSALEALNIEAQASRSPSREAFLRDVSSAVKELWHARPTEPALRNSLRYVFVKVTQNKSKDPAVLKRLIAAEAKGYAARVDVGKEKIARYGSRLIPEDARVLVHCHSSTVMRILKRAHDEGKAPHVFCTESRPLYQGHITAKELSKHGLKVTMFVDGATHLVLSQMRDTDLVLVGADAITSQGDLVNKVGTSMIAHAAFDHEKRFYSCTATHKFDPMTLFGWPEPIELRDPAEVASPKEFKGVELYNPAFDLTPARLVTGYVTELGILPPAGLVAGVSMELRLDREDDV